MNNQARKVISVMANQGVFENNNNTLKRLMFSSSQIRNQLLPVYLKKFAKSYYLNQMLRPMNENTLKSIRYRVKRVKRGDLPTLLAELNSEPIMVNGNQVSKKNALKMDVEMTLIAMGSVLNRIPEIMVRSEGRIVDERKFKHDMIKAFTELYGNLTVSMVQKIVPNSKYLVNTFVNLNRYKSNIKARSKRVQGLPPVRSVGL